MRNNFDFLRISAASAVLISHQFALSGLAEPEISGYHSLGGLGVLVFFSISGFLVTTSWQRDPHLGRFALRRLLRIWPGLMVLVLLSVFALGPVLTSLSLTEYFRDAGTWRYLRFLLMLDVYELPGVFQNNVNHAVNGSLWTLPIEVSCYVFLAAVGLLRGWRWALLACTVVAATHYFAVVDIQALVAAGGTRHWREEFGLFFLAGACLALFPDRRAWFGVAAAGSILLALGKLDAGLWLVLPALIITLGLSSSPVASRFGRFGDFSYGVYIYAFPVQQVTVQIGLPVYAGMALAAALTLALSAVSWHLIESPALRIKPRLRTSLPATNTPLRWRLFEK